MFGDVVMWVEHHMFETKLQSVKDAKWVKDDTQLDVDDLQKLMGEAYAESNKKQFKILADPKNKEFIELNINELRKMV